MQRHINSLMTPKNVRMDHSNLGQHTSCAMCQCRLLAGKPISVDRWSLSTISVGEERAFGGWGGHLQLWLLDCWREKLKELK
jgi:hypothetical protein